MQNVDESPMESQSRVQRRLPGIAWPPEVRAAAIALFEEGYGYKKASTQLGVPTVTTQLWRGKWIKETALPGFCSHTNEKLEEIKEKVYSLHRAGNSLNQIQAELKISRATLYVWLRRKGLIQDARVRRKKRVR